MSDPVTIIAPCGEAIPVFTALVLVGGKLYKADPTNASHENKFIGVSMQQSDAGMIAVAAAGELTAQKSPWAQDAIYYVGLNGALSTTPTAPGALWSLRVGFARATNILEIAPSILPGGGSIVTPVSLLGSSELLYLFPGNPTGVNSFCTNDQDGYTFYSGAQAFGVEFHGSRCCSSLLAVGAGSSLCEVRPNRPWIERAWTPYLRLRHGWTAPSGGAPHLGAWFGAIDYTVAWLGFDTTVWDLSTLSVAAFRYQPYSAAADPALIAYTSDGGGATTTNTGIGYTIDTLKSYDIDFTEAGHVKFLIDGVVVADHTTHLPVSTQPLVPAYVMMNDAAPDPSHHDAKFWFGQMFCQIPG